MKNIHMAIIVLALLLSFTGCTKETKTPAADPVTGSIALSAQYAAENETAAFQTKAAGDLTYTLEVWTEDYSGRIVRKVLSESELSADGNIEISLVPGIYNFLFWADYNNGHYATDEAVSGLAGGLRSVEYVYSDNSDMGSLDGWDAFALCKERVDWGTDGTSPSLEAVLTRPLAKLSIKAAGNFTADDADASIQCSNIPVRYDVATASATASATVVFPASIKAGSPEIGGLFLFAPREASVEVSLLGLGNGNETRNLGGISVAPNYVTNVTVTMNNN